MRYNTEYKALNLFAKYHLLYIYKCKYIYYKGQGEMSLHFFQYKIKLRGSLKCCFFCCSQIRIESFHLIILNSHTQGLWEGFSRYIGPRPEKPRRGLVPWDRLILLSQNWGPIKPVLNLLRCFTSCTTECTDNIGLLFEFASTMHIQLCVLV
jgi:hypothetical protein